MAAKRAVQPAIGQRMLGATGLQHILPIKMRARAIGRGRGMEDGELARFPERHQIGKRGVEAEMPVEIEAAHSPGPVGEGEIAARSA